MWVAHLSASSISRLRVPNVGGSGGSSSRLGHEEDLHHQRCEQKQLPTSQRTQIIVGVIGSGSKEVNVINDGHDDDHIMHVGSRNSDSSRQQQKPKNGESVLIVNISNHMKTLKLESSGCFEI